MLIFKSEQSRIKRWLDYNGYIEDSVDGELVQLFSGLSGLTTGTLVDHAAAVLVNLGYSGTLRDMLDAFFSTSMSISDPRDAERAFWDSNSSSWGGTGGRPYVKNRNGTIIKNRNGTKVTYQ
jgi:hypothetical protein